MTDQIIKWPGSKRMLIADLLKIGKPAVYGRTYREPFIGSAALYFALEPADAVLSDTLCNLMNMYQMVALYPDAIYQHLEEIKRAYEGAEEDESRETFYYDIRFNFNLSARPSPMVAAWFIFLNKAGFNGLWRENASGEMNVPWGKRRTLALPPRTDIRIAYTALQRAELRCCDFEDALIDAEAGDFVYLDPPYDGAFTGYSADGFDDEDQRRLARLVGCLTDYGVYCMVSNSNTERVRDLYKPYIQHRITANRSIAASAESRGEVQELVITNFDSEGRLI